MINKEKIIEWVNVYLEHVEEVGIEKHVNQDPKIGEEGYKFASVDHFIKNFNIEATDLANMLDNSIVDSNLVSGANYLPKRMLLKFAEEYENETRKILRSLFDENTAIYQRLDNCRRDVETLIAVRNKKLNRKDTSYIGLRFLSLMISFNNPNKYNAIKPRNWRNYCNFVNDGFNIPNGSSVGQQYRIYENYIEELRQYISNIPEIIEIRRRITDGLNFKDDEFRWMTQNVIYIGSKQFDSTVLEESKKEERQVIEEDDPIFETGDDFKSETSLEIHIAKHWKTIPYFSDFELQKGKATHGGQYPTENKSIDLLAYSKKRKSWLVIELKKTGNPDSYKSVGQIQVYMGYVKESQWVKAGNREKYE